MRLPRKYETIRCCAQPVLFRFGQEHLNPLASLPCLQRSQHRETCHVRHPAQPGRRPGRRRHSLARSWPRTPPCTPACTPALLTRLAGIGTLHDVDALLLDDADVWPRAVKLRAREVLFAPATTTSSPPGPGSTPGERMTTAGWAGTTRPSTAPGRRHASPPALPVPEALRDWTAPARPPPRGEAGPICR